MSTDTKTESSLFPLEINAALIVVSPDDLVDIIIRESNDQLAEKGQDSEEAALDFVMSCDGLNLWRVMLRCQEEVKQRNLKGVLKPLYKDLCAGICGQREYDAEEFSFAVEATKERVRVPYGLNPLEVAIRRAERKPIKLLKEGLQDAKLAAKIAAIALQLHEQGLKSYIMLPIDQLRQILGCRKVVVSGAVMKLIKAGIVKPDLEVRYHTGRARQFAFVALEGQDYEYVR